MDNRGVFRVFLTQDDCAKNHWKIIDRYTPVSFARQVLFQNHISGSQSSHCAILNFNFHVPSSDYEDLTQGRIVPG
jgi:hypothetical protein